MAASGARSTITLETISSAIAFEILPTGAQVQHNKLATSNHIQVHSRSLQLTTRFLAPKTRVHGTLIFGCLRHPKFSRFDTIPACDRHTHRYTRRQRWDRQIDRQTDRRTDNFTVTTMDGASAMRKETRSI